MMRTEDMREKRRYAIYGGSFDPVHIGHVSLADCAVKQCGLDELIFMPAYISPFKQDRKVTDGKDRIAMLETVLGYNPSFSVSDYEIKKGGPSYTVETLRYFRDRDEGKLHFVCGFDSIVQLDTWYEGPEILKDYPVITVRRPDTDDSLGMEKIGAYRRDFGADITVLDMPPVDASSTEIREKVRRGESISGLVLPETEGYIIEHKLYR